jgi:polysaccharide biosynthesis transport protein
LRVIRALNLKEHPDFKPKKNSPEASPDEIEEGIVGQFMGNLQVNPIKNSFLVEVSYQSPDKQLAKAVVNAIADEYMYLSINRRAESFVLVRKWLDNQLHELGEKVQGATRKLNKFAQKTDIYSLEEKDNVVVQKFIDLSGLLTKAQADKMGKEAQYKQIEAKGPDAPLIVNHPLMAALRQQLVGQQAKVSSMQRVLRSGHPDLQVEKANLGELQNRLKSEVKRLQSSIKADYEAATRTENLIKDSFSSQKERMAKLQDNLTDFQILKRDAQTNEQLYQALLSRVKEANISSTMVPSNVAVIDPGLLPRVPFKPKTSRNLTLAVILGLTVGVGLALVVEYLDDSLKSVNDLERACNVPSLGIIPLLIDQKITLGSLKGSAESMFGRCVPWRRSSDHSIATISPENVDLISFTHPKSSVTEAMRQTQTSIMLSASGKPPCIIMVTSPNPSEGKTSVSTNLALSFAMNEKETLLIDCDLRKPRIHRIFDLPATPGLSNYLSGSSSLEEIIRPTAIPNLSLISAGVRPPNPITLFNSEIFKSLLTQLRSQFPHIIIDTPPILGFADSRIISVLSDGVILVTKYHSTSKSASRLASQLLSSIHAPIMGSLLNSVGAYGKAYGGYYYNYSHYKYYSKYTDDNKE